MIPGGPGLGPGSEDLRAAMAWHRQIHAVIVSAGGDVEASALGALAGVHRACIRQCAIPNWRRGLGWRCGPHGRPAAGRLGRFAVVDTAGPGGGAGHDRTRSADDVREHAQRMRSLPAGHIIRDVMFSPLNAAQVKLGAARRTAAARLERRGARARASLSAGGGHQADRPGAGTVAAGSGDCGGPRGPGEASRRKTIWAGYRPRRRQARRSYLPAGHRASSAATSAPRPPATPGNPFAVRHHRRFAAATPAGGKRTRRRLSAAACFSSVKPPRRAPAEWCRPAVSSAPPRCTARRRRGRTGGRHASSR